jgi:hypothetical protein
VFTVGYALLRAGCYGNRSYRGAFCVVGTCFWRTSSSCNCLSVYSDLRSEAEEIVEHRALHNQVALLLQMKLKSGLL